MGRRLSLRRAVRLRCARSPYPIPYPLPIYSDHKGTDILSPSDRDPVTIPEERDPRSIRNGRRGRGNSNRDPKGNESPETVSRWRRGNRGETIPRPEDVLSPFRWYIIPIRETRVTERTGETRERERGRRERRRPERPSGGMETASGISVLPYYRFPEGGSRWCLFYSLSVVLLDHKERGE